jgi:hypothetical protein
MKSAIPGKSTFDNVYGRNVGWGPCQAVQFFRLKPNYVRMLGKARLSGYELTVEGRETHDAEVVLVDSSGNFGAHLYLTVKLFHDFALKGFAGRLSSFNLSARELPHAAESTGLAALGTENQTVSKNYGANHVDLLCHNYLASSVLV